MPRFPPPGAAASSASRPCASPPPRGYLALSHTPAPRLRRRVSCFPSALPLGATAAAAQPPGCSRAAQQRAPRAAAAACGTGWAQGQYAACQAARRRRWAGHHQLQRNLRRNTPPRRSYRHWGTRPKTSRTGAAAARARMSTLPRVKRTLGARRGPHRSGCTRTTHRELKQGATAAAPSRADAVRTLT